ncbi:MAG: DNA polymerase I [Planctomycetes bacterium]|nr:DNA polymerase I [Planctomycetota bacterium]
MSKDKTLFLVDGHALAYRMFYALQKQNLTAEGKPTGAILGFTKAVLRLLDNHKPNYFAVVFDPSGPTFRNDMYDKYKATRQKMPPELAEQLPQIRDVLSAMKCTVIEVPGFEADDVIGTLAKKFEARDLNVVLYSGDKDFMQLISDRVKMLKPGTGGKEDSWIGIAEVEQKFGVEPAKVIEALALIGDASDNVPGVEGVGEKTAAKLLREHGSLDAILENPERLNQKKSRAFLSKAQNVDLIRLSRKLVTIDTDVPLKTQLVDLRLREFDNEKLFEISKRLKFRSLLNRFAPRQAQLGFEFGTEKSAEKRVYHLVDTMGKFEAMLKKLKACPGFAFDTETTDLNPMQAHIVGISFAIEAGEAWYVPLWHVEKGTYPQPATLRSGNLPATMVWSALKPILEDPNIDKCAHNIKYDVLVLANDAGIQVSPFSFDTMVAAWVLDPARRQNGLKELSLELLDQKMTAYRDVVGKGKDQLNFAEVDLQTAADYGAADSDFTIRLKELFEPELGPVGLDKLFTEIEMPLIPVLMAMEKVGVSIHLPFFEDMSIVLADRLADLEIEIYDLAEEKFNINSPKQLRELFYDRLMLPVLKKTPKGEPSTDADTLERLAKEHDLPAKIIDYRELAKLKGTYVDALPKLIDPQTGRIHTSYNQTVTPTGRLSSSDPNLQNIPVRTEIGKEIRKGFVPGPGYDLLLSADYSQIELRVLAHYAGDSALMEAFRKDEDIHRRTAATVFGCSIDEVTPEMRRTAKTTNFGLIYGQTAFGLAKALGIKQAQAKEFIDCYFMTYPGVKNYIDDTIDQAKLDGFVTTLCGRRRQLPDIRAENRNIRQYAERTAINTPIQGTAADMIKLAMISVQQKLKQRRTKSRMILQVHDELVFEVVRDELEMVKELVIETMESALPLDVPLKVDVGVGLNWFEAH